MSSEKVWVRSHQFQCAPACQGACQYYPLKDALDANQEVLRKIVGKETHMSAAVWCDRGEHAFSANDRGRKQLAEISVDDDGNEQTIRMDICGKCAATFKMSAPVAAIPASVPVQTSQSQGYDGGDGTHDVPADRIYRPDQP